MSPGAGGTHQGCAASGGHHHIRLECRADPLGGGGRARMRARSRDGRPRHGPGVQRRRRLRLSRRHSGIPHARHLRLPAARQGRGAADRLAGRATRRTRTHRPGRASGYRVVERRSRDLLLAHDPGQREGSGRDHQQPYRTRGGGHHRSDRDGARLRPSPPRRTCQDVRMDPPAYFHPGSRRGASPRRAREVRAKSRHSGGRAGP